MTASPETIPELIASVADQYEPASAGFISDTVTEIDGTYHVTVQWAFPDGVPSFPFSDGRTELYVTDDREQQVIVRFEALPRRADYVLMYENEAVHKVSLLSYDGTASEHGLSTLMRTLSEVHLTAEGFVEFVMGGDQRVDHVEVASYTSRSSQRAEAVSNIVFNDDSNTTVRDIGGCGDDGIWFLVALHPLEHYEIDGIWSKNRFAHVESLEVNGEKFPVDIETRTTPTDRGERGQWVHTSEFLVESVGVKKLDIDKELFTIDFRELLHGDAPWPEAPGMIAHGGTCFN